MNTYCGSRSSRGEPIAPRLAMGHWLFSFALLDVPLWVRLRPSHLREARGAGLNCLATGSMGNPGFFVILLLIGLVTGLPAWAQQHGQQHHSDRRGPSDIKQYIESLERPERDKDQKPDEVIKALNLDDYMTIADIGAGSGYFTRKFVWAVQDKGMVYAIDVEPAMLKYNEEMIEHLHTPYNAKFVLAKPDDPMLPAKSVDLIFLCNTYHHLENRPAYFKRASAALKPGGRVAIIDFYHDERAGEVGFPKEHLVPKEKVIQEMTDAGYKLTKEHSVLQRQYFLEFVPSEKAKVGGENY